MLRLHCHGHEDCSVQIKCLMCTWRAQDSFSLRRRFVRNSRTQSQTVERNKKKNAMLESVIQHTDVEKRQILCEASQARSALLIPCNKGHCDLLNFWRSFPNETTAILFPLRNWCLLVHVHRNKINWPALETGWFFCTFTAVRSSTDSIVVFTGNGTTCLFANAPVLERVHWCSSLGTKLLADTKRSTKSHNNDQL